MQDLTTARIAALTEALACEPEYGPLPDPRLAQEYELLNAALGALTIARMITEKAEMLPFFESPVERDERGMPVGGGEPRPMYGKLKGQIVEAENALLKLRDRNGFAPNLYAPLKGA